MSKKKVVCCFCGKELTDPIVDGNNPSPLDNDPKHVCCLECDDRWVLPARISHMAIPALLDEIRRTYGYRPGESVEVDMDEAFRQTGGEIAEATVIRDKGKSVLVDLVCFAFPDGHQVTIPKKAIL